MTRRLERQINCQIIGTTHLNAPMALWHGVTCVPIVTNTRSGCHCTTEGGRS